MQTFNGGQKPWFRGGWPLHTSRVIITFLSCDSGRLLKVIANSCTNRRLFLGLLWSAPSWQSSNALCKWTRRPLTSTLVSQGRRLRRTWGPSGPGHYFHSFLPYLSWILKGSAFYIDNRCLRFPASRYSRWLRRGSMLKTVETLSMEVLYLTFIT